MYNGFGKKPKFAIAASMLMAAMLLGTTAISILTTAESVFAYRNNQATSQISDCGNGFSPQSVGCQNIDSQIQGDGNAVALAAQQTFPPPRTCVECFNSLSLDQRAAFEELISRLLDQVGIGQASTIEELCALFETFDPIRQGITLRLVEIALFRIGVDSDNIIGCLTDVLGIPTPG